MRKAKRILDWCEYEDMVRVFEAKSSKQEIKGKGKKIMICFGDASRLR